MRKQIIFFAAVVVLELLVLSALGLVRRCEGSSRGYMAAMSEHYSECERAGWDSPACGEAE